MTIHWFTNKPAVGAVVQWDGTNVAEFEQAFQRQFTVNGDVLHDENGTDIPLGKWYLGLDYYDEAPSWQQEVSGPAVHYVIVENE